MTSRGFNEEEFKKIGKIIATALKNPDDEKVLKELKEEVLALTSKHPLWY
jgi:glycine hydroxymethyltransferase